MLTKIRLKNFKSFKKETVIDVVASKYTILNDTNIVDGICKGLLFVGGNATGKTNTIASLALLLDLLFANAYVNIPLLFCLNSRDKSMFLEYTFKFENDIIIYYIEFERDGTIIKENLSLNNETMLNRLNLFAESFLTENKNYNENNIDKKTLFLKVIYFNTKFTNFPSLKKWFDFLSNSVYFNVQRASTFLDPAQSFNRSNSFNIYDYLEKNGVDEINKFLNSFNFKQSITYGPLAPNAGVQLGLRKEIFLKRDYIDVKIPLLLESLGNQTLLAMLPSLLHVIENDCMLLVDEFNSAFHNDLEELLVKFFMEKSKKSQMFFVSHSTNLLKTSLLRPDQVYTVDYNDNRGSRVNRISTFKPRESQNLEKMYLSGVFDGLPNYGDESDVKA